MLAWLDSSLLEEIRSDLVVLDRKRLANDVFVPRACVLGKDWVEEEGEKWGRSEHKHRW